MDSQPDNARLFPLADAPTHPMMPLGRGGKLIPTKTMRNWVAKGRLRTVVIGGRRYTSGAWIREMTEGSTPADRRPVGRTRGERKKSHERAAALLAAEGF